MKHSVHMVFFSLAFFTVGCGYNVGISKKPLPEGYSQVAIPVFKNSTHETGIEVSFTNSLIKQFAMSREVKVISNKSKAPVWIEGTIENIQYKAESQADSTSLPNLPSDTVLTTKYRIFVTTYIKLIKISDNKVIWQGRFTNEKDYAAPQLESPGINSANALYNHSSRNQSIAEIAEAMMVDVHGRMTENF